MDIVICIYRNLGKEQIKGRNLSRRAFISSLRSVFTYTQRRKEASADVIR